MGFPRRPRAQPVQASSTSESSRSTLHDSQRSIKRVKLEKGPLFDAEDVKIFIVVAKLSPDEVRDATKAIESNGGKVVTQFEECTIVLSNTRLWNRLKGYLPDEGYGSKKIVNMTWLSDSITAEEQQPFTEKYLIHTPSALDHIHLDSETHRPTSASPAPSDGGSIATVTGTPEPNEAVSETIRTSSPMYPTTSTALWKTDRDAPPKWVNKRFACQRWHPLVCINQSLLMELKWIRDAHKMALDERRSATYAKAMASIKAYPYTIKNRQEAQGILGVGEKIAAQCDEYAKSGKIAAAEKVKADGRHHVLLQFSRIHGVGASTANELYDKYKCRTMNDVEQIAHILPSMGERSTQHVEEFDMKIPRAEVDEIADVVNEHLQRIIPGAEYTVVGGYRRGKAESNDVDIVFTHPDEAKEKGALQLMLKSLQNAGLVTDVLYVAMTDSKRDSSMQHFHASHMDPLDKAFMVWKSPANGTTRMKPIHRRVDLIAAPKKYYACAILGWSGSTTFERDLRLYADKVKGMKFDSGGLWVRANSKEIIVKTEKEIFDVLGLEYIPPEWRNCDV